MKILVLWSYSTWKTTIINEMKKHYPNLNFSIVPDTAREILEEKNINVNTMTKEDVINFQIEIFERIKLHKEKLGWTQNYIIDWWEILLLIYFFDIHPNLKKYSNFIKDVYEEFYKTNYDLVLYTPIEFRIEDDWIRHKDYIKRMNIDKRIRNYLDSTEMSHLYLTWTISNRIEIIWKYIDDHQQEIKKDNLSEYFSNMYWFDVITELKNINKDNITFYKQQENAGVFEKLNNVLWWIEDL